jgi:hypothetical protein
LLKSDGSSRKPAPGQRAALLLAVGLAVLAAAPAEATQVIIRSHAPYWEVGVRDPVLSQLCSTGRFNEMEISRYVIQFNGQDGSGSLGIAKGTGLNLRDIDHRAVTKEDYFFFRDGTSDCSVFVGGRKPKPKTPPQPGTKPGQKPIPASTAQPPVKQTPILPGPAVQAPAAPPPTPAPAPAPISAPAATTPTSPVAPAATAAAAKP